MNSDAMRYQPTLRLYEEDLLQIEEERERLEGEILRMQSELKLLAIKRVSRLEMSAVTKNGLGIPLTDEELKHLPPQVQAVSDVPPDLCKDKKIVEAAETYLEWRNEPATHGEVMKGMRAGGFETEYVSFDNSLRSAMQRSGKFKRYKNAKGAFVWALLEWINRAPDRPDSELSEKPNLTVVRGSEAQAKSA